MSSSLRPRTLRAKLVVGQIVLAVALCLVVGGVAVLALREFLVNDLDRQLSLQFKPGPPGRQNFGPPPIGIDAQTAQDGSIIGTIAVHGGDSRTLTDDESAALASLPA